MYLLDCLTTDFTGCLEYFVNHTPFDSGYEDYLRTVKLRANFSNVLDAISSDSFLKKLHATLRGFFRLRRSVPLVPLEQFTL
jgi:hypothetical protein